MTARSASFIVLLTLACAPTAQARQGVTLRVASWATAEEFELENRIADRFEALHPGVRVLHESIPSGYRDKILASFAAGTVPDVLLMDSPIIPALLNRDLMVDLAPHLDSLGIDSTAWFPRARSIFENDGALYALPKDFTPLVMYFNRKLFAEAGLLDPDPDWTWDQFLATARALTLDRDDDGRPDQYGTAFDNKLYLWQPWVWMTGGDILGPGGRSARGAADAPATVRALQFLVDLRTRHGVTPAIVGAGGESGGNIQATTGLFYAGRLAMMSSGHWSLLRMLPYIRSGELDVGVVPLPRPADGEHRTIIYAAGWSVPRTSPHRDWAMRLAAFLAGPEAARMRAETPIGVPALRSIAEEQARADSFGVESVFLREAAFGGQSWGTRIDAFSRVEDLLERAVDRAMIGGEPLTASMEQAAAEIDRMLADQASLSHDVASLRGDRDILRFVGGGFLVLTLVLLGALVFVTGTDRRRLLRGYGFLTPSLLVLLVFVAVPLAFSLYLSVHRWDIVSSVKPFVGLGNFADLVRDREFWGAFRNTLIYTLHVPVGMALSLGVAWLLNRKIRGVNVWRTLFFLPSISSMVAIAMVWQWIYHPEFGLANYALGLLGLSGVPWLSDTGTALLSVMLVSIWMGVGYQMVIFLAGLKSIPTSYYDAARVDGAGPWQRFRYVTLPLLRPTTFFVLVTSIISSFQVFTLVFVMTEGGPLGSTDVIVYHVYRNAYDYLRMGYASAMAWVLFLVVLAVTWLQFRVGGRRVTYG